MIREYGGEPGVRDLARLSSALAQPSVTFEGRFLHSDLMQMAGAMLFALVKNHAFLDGNKRTALAATEVFLILNGNRLAPEANDALYDLTMAIAKGELRRSDASTQLRSLAADNRAS